MPTPTSPFVRVAAACLLAALVRGQDWRTESIPSLGLEFDAPSRLERLPMQLGENALYHRARLRPKDDADFVRGQFYWYCDVYEFSKAEAKPGAGGDGLPDGVPEEMRAELQRLLARLGGKRKATFKDWLHDKNAELAKEKGKFEILTAGKERKGRAGKLDFAHWVWKEATGFGPCGIVYCEAAVYTFGDREVALVIEMPLETDKPGVPKSKWKNIIDRMIPSGKAAKVDETGDDVDKKRDQYADTPDKKEALAAAKRNIEGLQGWDYFTQPNYIVLYSWNFERPDERARSRKDALYYSSRLEKMRELYIASYPLDATGQKAVMPDPASIPSLTGPITGAGQPKPAEPAADAGGDDELPPPAAKEPRQPYSVFRLCATYEQFQKYGQSPPGVVGWYSPSSKELVVFLGGDKMMGQGATETVTYHEGWHQFADFYFHPPGAKKYATLHRWFDEGHGDYFGSFRWGTNGWKYVGSKMRYDDCKQMVRQGDYVPFRDIVYWDRRRFYSERAPYYYAQAFSMIDFLRRGEKQPGWRPQWGEILDMYRKVVLVHGDAKLAVDTAFRGFTDADWKALEEAWKAWVSGPNFLSGK
jgi:hypothetical protein